MANLKHWPPAPPPPKAGGGIFVFGFPQESWQPTGHLGPSSRGFYSCLAHAPTRVRVSLSAPLKLFCLQLSGAASPLGSSWAPWNSVVNHLHSLPITGPHSTPHSFNNHLLRANQRSSPELGNGTQINAKDPSLPLRMGHSWSTEQGKLNGETNCN